MLRDRNMAADAIFRAGGAGDGIALRVIFRAPDEQVDWQRTQIATETFVIEVPVAKVAQPVAGDTFEIDGNVWVVYGQPRRDAEGVFWTIEAARS
jgi:hypothetical protein